MPNIFLKNSCLKSPLTLVWVLGLGLCAHSHKVYAQDKCNADASEQLKTAQALEEKMDAVLNDQIPSTGSLTGIDKNNAKLVKFQTLNNIPQTENDVSKMARDYLFCETLNKFDPKLLDLILNKDYINSASLTGKEVDLLSKLSLKNLPDQNGDINKRILSKYSILTKRRAASDGLDSCSRQYNQSSLYPAFIKEIKNGIKEVNARVSTHFNFSDPDGARNETCEVFLYVPLSSSAIRNFKYTFELEASSATPLISSKDELLKSNIPEKRVARLQHQQQIVELAYKSAITRALENRSELKLRYFNKDETFSSEFCKPNFSTKLYCGKWKTQINDRIESKFDQSYKNQLIKDHSTLNREIVTRICKKLKFEDFFFDSDPKIIELKKKMEFTFLWGSRWPNRSG